jgi:hypothetical protein
MNKGSTLLTTAQADKSRIPLSRLNTIETAEMASMAGISQRIVEVDTDINWWWHTVLRVAVFVLAMLALKVLSFVSYTKANYREFINFVDTINERASRVASLSWSSTLYTGPSGLRLALALNSTLVNWTLSNEYTAEAMYIAYSTPATQSKLLSSDGPTFLQSIYETAALGALPEDSQSSVLGKQLDAPGIVCTAYEHTFGTKPPDCEQSCTSGLASGQASAAAEYANSATQSGTNFAMLGHVVGTGLGYGTGFTVAAAVAGIALGVVQTQLDQEGKKKRCEQAQSLCVASLTSC